MEIYLGSKSPRRKELLTQMEVPFEVLTVDIAEITAPHESPAAYSRRITEEKMQATWQKISTEQRVPKPVLCADTEVVLDQKILGKPSNKEEAFSMLKSYSGKCHEVLTSVGLKYLNYEKVMMNKTLVTFAAIPDAAINHYLSMDNYKDKSGSYGIQSYIGQYISKIEGCFYSVMGLPLNTVRELLLDLTKKIK
ncbi:MAG: septum formation protein Maf [Legionella sp.]|nr:septum formation protein Maf [Legionella sp.]